jgi:hypothetical protein
MQRPPGFNGDEHLDATYVDRAEKGTLRFLRRMDAKLAAVLNNALRQLVADKL